MIVQKFGGTSVADPDAIRRLIEIVRSARGEKGPGPIVVVSAMSGVTDGLLSAAASASAAHGEEALAKVRQLRAKHIDAVQALCAGTRAAAAAEFVNARFDELDSMLTGVSILREVSGRTLDAIAASGELLSSRIIAAAIEEAGLPATWLDARRLIVTDDEHTSARPLARETNAALRATILPALADGHVPVLGGFIGATREGMTTTLGRGGSDYSGALVGAGVGAGEIQIWTDVDGMMTADPRVVTGPRLVPRLSFGEASELAYFGAKVLHPSTIHPAVEHEIPVRIVNSRKPDGKGTLITASRDSDGAPFAALACKKGITVVDITSDRMLMAYGFLRRVFEVFERFRTPVDVVTTSEVSVSVTVDDRRQLDAVIEALGEFAEVSSEFDCALLCAVGDNLRMEPTIASRVLRCLEDVPLRMVSQAASRRNMTVVLREADLGTAMQRLHSEFFA